MVLSALFIMNAPIFVLRPFVDWFTMWFQVFVNSWTLLTPISVLIFKGSFDQGLVFGRFSFDAALKEIDTPAENKLSFLFCFDSDSKLTSFSIVYLQYTELTLSTMLLKYHSPPGFVV